MALACSTSEVVWVHLWPTQLWLEEYWDPQNANDNVAHCNMLFFVRLAIFDKMLDIVIYLVYNAGYFTCIFLLIFLSFVLEFCFVSWVLQSSYLKTSWSFSRRLNATLVPPRANCSSLGLIVPHCWHKTQCPMNYEAFQAGRKEEILSWPGVSASYCFL